VLLGGGLRKTASQVIAQVQPCSTGMHRAIICTRSVETAVRRGRANLCIRSMHPCSLTGTRMCADFAKLPPPKSTDAPTMIALFEEAVERNTCEPEPHAIGRAYSARPSGSRLRASVSVSGALRHVRRFKSSAAASHAAVMRMLHARPLQNGMPICSPSELPITLLNQGDLRRRRLRQGSPRLRPPRRARWTAFHPNVPSATGRSARWCSVDYAETLTLCDSAFV